MDRISMTSVLWLAAMAFSLACPASAGASQDLGAAAIVFETPQVLRLLGEGPESDSPPAVQVLRSSEQVLELEFTLPAMSVQALEMEGDTYHVLEIAGGGVTGDPGEPMLPTFSRLVQIPDQAAVSLEVIELETTELVGYRPIPMQPEEAAEFTINPDAYARVGYAEAAPARVGDPAIARDLRVVPIRFSPVRYDPSRQAIEVASRIQVRITYPGVDRRNAKLRHSPTIPDSFDRLYRSLVANYAGPREGQRVALGTYVLICPENAAVVSALQPLVEWRTRKGHTVYLATTAETGSSAQDIKDWLQAAYDTWENPPEFVALVGDTGGSVAIPCWNGPSDHNYVQLDGGDLLADAHIGRISVDSVERLQLYVNKIVGYESTPHMDDTGWFTRACLTGDPGASGITCVQIMQWLKIRLLEYGYTDVDTVFSSPFVSQSVASLNQGTTVFCYRGYLGMSGISSGVIATLTNGPKMPFAVNSTCGTGDFSSGTSISEVWIRAGVPPDLPTGGIASVGTATYGTHTRYNNCVTYGIWRGVFYDEMYTFGAAFTRGKYELYINYGLGDPSNASTWTRLNNLMGDPGGEMWTGVPRMITVSHPASIPRGANAVTVNASILEFPCPDAYACLWMDGVFHAGGYTGPEGTVELPVETQSVGEILVTVTKHDHHPYLGSLTVEVAERYVGYLAHHIDDDWNGTSIGNGDGIPNPTERIEIPVQVSNYGTQSADDVTGLLTTSDPYVTILDDNEAWGDIPAMGSAWSDDDFDIEISGDAPNGHVIRLGLDLTSGADSWRSLIEITVVAGEFVYEDMTLYDFGTAIDPGETGEISVTLANVGGASGINVIGTLATESPWVTVTDATGAFGSIAGGTTGENTEDRFGIDVSAECFVGHIATATLYLEFSGGISDTVHFAISVGTASASDPTGPDAYGYYAFDNTDTGYIDAPTYAWVEIAPNHGGPGADVGLTDFGGVDDDSQVVDLPFAFMFYGETFTRATICSNGWIAMGSTYLENRRNWNIPGAGAPPYLIAPMWDNLYQSGEDLVYHWYDAAQHRYIVQWSRLRNNAGGAIENFQAILYDPVYYPTVSGDGEIVFQYEEFHNVDNVQHYCTVGIENVDQTDGVLYSYFNLYNSGAATITSGRAIKFTALSALPRGVLSGTIVNATNGGTPLAGASIDVVECDMTLTSAQNGAYSGSVPEGVYTVIAAHPSFEPDTCQAVAIIEGQTTVLDFSLEDIAPPIFAQTTIYANTGDDQGPYEIYSTVTEYSDLTQLSLFYNVAGAGWIEVPMADLGENLYLASIPGQPQGLLVKYYLSAEDAGGLTATDPASAPWENYAFWVLAPLFEEDVEGGAGNWTHYAVADTMADEWHLSELQNHTPAGSWSWMFGDEDSGNYADLSDGALETPVVNLDVESTLIFWHWIDAEVSAAHAGYAYDGGLVEMSVDGGEWLQIEPVGGYPYLVRDGSILGPFPADTPIFSGTFDWRAARFDLGETRGAARFRFRFGSDGAVTATGWHIDDVAIIPAEPGAAGVEDPRPVPTLLALAPNRPNPFGMGGPGTRIGFDLPAAAAVQLRVLDTNGRIVRNLVSGTLPAGRHEVLWNGRGPQGHPVESGVYFYILKTGDQQLARRLLLVR